MQIRAAVLEEFANPLVVQDVELEGPGPGEVLVRLAACGVCHTDLYTASGADPPATRRRCSATRASGVVEEVGEGVTSVAPGDHVVTLFSPQCRECIHCLSDQTNLCLAIREQQNKGYLPDGTTRLHRNGDEHPPLHGHEHVRRGDRDAGDRARQGEPRGAARRDLHARLRRHHGHRRRALHRQGRAGLDLRGLRRRAGRPRRGGRRAARRRRADRRGRPLRGAARARAPAGRHRHARRRPRRGRPDPRDDRRLRRRLHLRGHRHRLRDAPGGRVGAHGLGPLHDRRAWPARARCSRWCRAT